MGCRATIGAWSDVLSGARRRCRQLIRDRLDADALDDRRELRRRLLQRAGSAAGSRSRGRSAVHCTSTTLPFALRSEHPRSRFADGAFAGTPGKLAAVGHSERRPDPQGIRRRLHLSRRNGFDLR